MVDKNNDVSVIIKTYAEDANKSLSALVTNLNILNNNINKINTSLNKTQSTSKKAKNEIKSLADVTKQLSSVSNFVSSSFNKMFDVGKLYLYWNVTKRIRDTLVQLINSSIDYIETQNLFDVSMGSQSENAYKFMNTMANTFGMARTELMNYQASFNNVLKSLPGLADETSYVLSETLMKMAGDYSSLFNFTLPQAMEKFQAALTGSVKPIRDKTGLDITEKTIQGVATNLGVEKTVGQLNQVEKRLLRIIALQDQLSQVGAMGDFAKTLESPANQLKVLQQQLKELGTWLGNVFIGTIGKILPYINGFVMALVAMAKALAIFVGYEETRYDDPLQIEDTTTSVDGLTSSLGGAASKAKELKKILMGFDVLNVITTPSEDSGGGGGSATSIDPAILGALKDYDNLMGDVEMKATKIRDRIMEWLGFEKIINEETGEITWKLKDGKTKLDEIIETVKTVGKVLLGAFVVKKIADFIIYIGSLSGALSKLGPVFATIGAGLSGLFDTLLLKIMYFGDEFVAVFGTGASGVLTVLGGIVAPIMAIGWAINTLNKPIADLSTETLLFDKSISDATKNSVLPFIEKINDLGTAIWGLELKDIVSEDDVNSIKEKTQEITDTLQKNIVDKYDTLKAQINDVELFPDVEKRNQYLQVLETSLQEEQSLIQSYNDRINEIVGKAAEENRNLTQSERVEIENIRKEMGEMAITELSENQEEALKIKAKFNENFQGLNLQQLADAIKQAKELKDSTIKEAEEEYLEKLAIAETMRDTIPGFTDEMYEQMTKDAKEEYDKQVKDAETAYDDIVKAAEEKYPEATKSINMETGNIKNGWETAATLIRDEWDKIKTTAIDTWDKIKQKFDEIKKKITDKVDEIKKKFTDLKQDVVDKFDEIKKGITDKIDTIKTKFSNLKTDITDIVDKLKTKWQEFKDKFTFPSIKTPHFSWTTTPATGWIADVLSALSLPTSIPKLSVSWYAQGGLPDVGEMFVAREAGPELVGKIGNSSAVVNNQQIVESVSRGVAQAVSQVMNKQQGGSYKFYLDGKEMTSVITKIQNRNLSVMGV